MAAVLPKNLALIVQRLANFNRAVVRTRPQSNDQAIAGQTIVWRLPTNTMVDLHNMQIGGAITITNTAGVVLGGPADWQGLIERLDIVVNGQVINGANADYGALYSLMQKHKMEHSDVSETAAGDFLKSGTKSLEGASFRNQVSQRATINASGNLYAYQFGRKGYQMAVDGFRATTGATYTQLNTSVASYPENTSTSSTGTANLRPFSSTSAPSAIPPPSGTASQVMPFLWDRFLGFLGGRFVRFIDTAVLGPVEIRIRLAPASVLFGQDVAADSTAGQFAAGAAPTDQNYVLNNLYMYLDTITFTDDFYRAILAKRLLDGGIITIPFDNFFSFQKAEDGIGAGTLTDTITFNLGTQSLNCLIGTLRDARYQSNLLKVYSANAMDSGYYHFTSGVDFSTFPRGTFQYLVNNQLYPTWPADINEAYWLTQAAFDQVAKWNKRGAAIDMARWRDGMFAFAQSFCHHDGDGDKIISGLDTRGASSNMQWMISNLNHGCSHLNATGTVGVTPVYRDAISGNGQYIAFIWAWTTSTLEISAGQNMVTIW